MAAAAILSLAACSTFEPVDTPDSLITFAVVNNLPQTRATAGLEYTNGPFGTFAWWTNNTWSNTADADKLYHVFMENQQITNTTGVWAPTTDYYWTKTGYITFASYSPYVSGAEKGFSAVPEYTVADGFKFDDYTVVDDTNIDVMYATLAENCTKNTNTDSTEVTDNANPESGYAGVPTIFHHALTKVQVAVRMKTERKNPNVRNINIEVTNITFQNINKKGSFVQLPNPTWTLPATPVTANYLYFDGSTTPEVLWFFENDDDSDQANPRVTTYTPISTSRMLLPQELTAIDTTDPTDNADNHQNVEISYRIKMWYKDNTTPAVETITSTVVLYNDAGSPAVTEWTPNMSVLYRITIDPYSDKKVTFDPAVIDWADTVNSDLLIEDVVD